MKDYGVKDYGVKDYGVKTRIEQADRKHHGGVDKAMLHYARDHYADWCTEQPELAGHLGEPGAFGRTSPR